MLWLQPFVKAAGTVPLSPACWVQQAWASREGRGVRLAGTGGTCAERSPDRYWAEVDGRWEGSPCGSLEEAVWQGVEGTQDTAAHLPRLSKASWYPHLSPPHAVQGCHGKDAAGMAFWAVCQGRRSALTPLGWCVSMNHWCWQS